jgi:hypothetical protein
MKVDRWPFWRCVLAGYISFLFEGYTLFFPPTLVDEDLIRRYHSRGESSLKLIKTTKNKKS